MILVGKLELREPKSAGLGMFLVTALIAALLFGAGPTGSTTLGLASFGKVSVEPSDDRSLSADLGMDPEKRSVALVLHAPRLVDTAAVYHVRQTPDARTSHFLSSHWHTSSKRP